MVVVSDARCFQLYMGGVFLKLRCQKKKSWFSGKSAGGTLINRQTIFKLDLQNIWDSWRILWGFGHQVEVSWSMALKNKQKHNFYDLHSLWLITQRFLSGEQHSDCSRRRKQTGSKVTERTMREKGFHSENNIKSRGKTKVQFLSSVWFHFLREALRCRGKERKSETKSGIAVDASSSFPALIFWVTFLLGFIFRRFFLNGHRTTTSI